MKPPTSLPSSIKKTRKTLSKKALHFSVCESNTNLNEKPSCILIEEKTNREKNKTGCDNDLLHNTVPITSSPLKKCTDKIADLDRNIIKDAKEKKGRVLVFSDEHGRGIRKILQKLLGQDFLVTSIIKPNAPLNEILKNCDKICKDFTDCDYVVLLAGSNDNDPLRFQAFLYYYISILAHTNVIIGEVYKNKYLNERKQNKTLQMVSSQFSHTRFIETYQFKHNKLYITQSFLREILNINFSVKYKYFNMNKNQNTGKTNGLQCYASYCTHNKPLRKKGRQLKINDFFNAIPNVKNGKPVLYEPSCLQFFRD